MKTLSFLLFVFMPVLCFGQTVQDVLSMVNAARTTQTVAVTATASQGDWSVLTVFKYSGSKISFGWTCKPGSGAQETTTLLTAGAAAGSQVISCGDVVMLIAWNPTSAAVTPGSLPAMPTGNAAYSYSTNIVTAGVITGQTAPVSGVVAWP